MTPAQTVRGDNAVYMADSDTITITDDRTGKTVTVPINGGVFPASAVRELDPSLFMRPQP